MRRSTSLHRSLLNNDAQRRADKVPNVNFLWSIPSNEEDQWLREELAKLAGGSELHLHRFVTIEEASFFDNFSQIAEKTRSGVDVGVFFCGPSAMASAIQETLRLIEVRSYLRGTYLSVLNDNQLASDFNIDISRDIKRLRRYGSNVRFVFHEKGFRYCDT